ncbi:nuclear-interacting partner of ALK-like [Homarus americanus]|uniref:nuclear-interacting partner of ALK-like n=1 Tax=Homarus americanus TaxID=6706 RepID=UPI001C450895|nr:nuclear-interacting partner of ALK-like [Homarus americanus]
MTSMLVVNPPSTCADASRLLIGDKESTGTTVSISTKTQPQNHEAFYSRVDSFRPGLWNVLEVSPLECARWGWHLLEKDVLQCVTCQEVVCAILPDPADREAYCKFLNLLKHRLRESHKEACGWRHNPSPEELMQTPCADTIEELRNMANSASTLSALNSALPHIDNTTLMNTLVREYHWFMLLNIFHEE